MNQKIEELRKRRDHLIDVAIPHVQDRLTHYQNTTESQFEERRAMLPTSNVYSCGTLSEEMSNVADFAARLTAELRDIDELLAAWESRPARCPACQTLLHNAKCPSPFCEADTAQ